jgi:hypothetical protein
MATKALVVRLEAKSGKEDAVEEFLLSALPLVEQEPGTKPWTSAILTLSPTSSDVSTATSGCEGSHVDGPRRHIGLVWPEGTHALRSRGGAGQRSAGPP